ncbi:MAG: matrixin family metalloprotease [Proteobacteria bacterium]|nr:MAG: matrixin family metalloprotease [Pseudomonadota bacterium]
MAGVLLLILSLISAPAFASVRTISEGGRPIFWPNPRVIFTTNPTNDSGLSKTQVDNLLGNAFISWMVLGSRVNISYLSDVLNGANSDYDGMNRVYFATYGDRDLDANVVALTEVLYFVNSGQIAEADMVFNDKDFLFTDQVGDTGSTTGASPYRSKIYLPDVATHEAGHALGLDHSNVNLSSLFYQAFNGQYAINPDDANMMLNMYPVGANTGAVYGTVLGTAGGVFGTQVSAINLATGKVQAATLANPDGTFRLTNLPDSSYSIFMEPFGTSVSTVSGYYKNIDHRFCGSSSTTDFKRRFYGPCGSTSAAVIQISGANAVDLKTLSPACAAMGSPTPLNTPINLSVDPRLGSVATISATGSVFGILDTNQHQYYRLHNPNGSLVARALSYSLFSPIDLSVELLDPATMSPLSGSTSEDNVETNKPGGGPNYDSRAFANVNGSTDVIVHVKWNSYLAYSKYPGHSELVDYDSFYLLSLSLDGAYGATGATDMAACAQLPNKLQSAWFKTSSPSFSETKTGCGSLGGPGAGGGGPGGGLTLLFTAAFLAQGYFWASRRAKALQLVRRRR